MHATEHQVESDIRCGLVPEDAECLFRPEDLSGRDVPAEAAGAAKPLRFGEKVLTALQRAFSTFAIFNVGIRSLGRALRASNGG